MKPTTDTRQHSLAEAFAAFNQVSEQLTGSYQQLHDRVIRLTAELAASNSDRMHQLSAKERLADRLAKLMEELPAGVVLLDAGRRIVEFNRAARLLLDQPEVGEDWGPVVHRSFRSDRSAGDLRTPDGRVVSLSECPLDQESGFILLLMDVTASRQLQDYLHRQARLSEMGKMAAQLAHQMRTPLSSALLYASHLGHAGLSTQQRQRFAERLQSRLLHMERQINDILAFARGNNGVARGLVSLPDLLEEMHQTAEARLLACGAHLSIDNQLQAPTWIEGNRDALLGAFGNLLDNALKHGGAGVCLSVRVAENLANNLEVSFTDNGPGIAPEYQSKVFDPFFTTSSDGTGLGLAVVQSVAMDHGGLVWLETPAEGGARFVVSLPIQRRQALTSREGHQSAAAADRFIPAACRQAAAARNPL